MPTGHDVLRTFVAFPRTRLAGSVTKHPAKPRRSSDVASAKLLVPRIALLDGLLKSRSFLSVNCERREPEREMDLGN
jgi:hypothetical protein